MGKLSKTIGAAGAAATAVYLSKKENREKVKNEVSKAKQDPKKYYSNVSAKAKQQVAKVKNKLSSGYKQDLGKPADLAESDMVEEGALTSVQYYNMLQEEDQ